MVADNESPVPAPSAQGRHSIPAAQFQAASLESPKPAPRGLDSGEGDKADDDEESAPVKAPAVVARPAPAAKIEQKIETRPAPRVAAREDANPRAVSDPAALGWKKGPEPVKPEGETSRAAAPKALAKSAPLRAETRVARGQPASADEPAHGGGWIIQIGATDEAAKASALLSRARTQARELAGAKPFTEKFLKGGAAFYRARFAGLDSSGAEQACKALRRGGFPCFATHLE
jgi:D-alanyl-D-alanine carboxypeptidase